MASNAMQPLVASSRVMDQAGHIKSRAPTPVEGEIEENYCDRLPYLYEWFREVEAGGETVRTDQVHLVSKVGETAGNRLAHAVAVAVL